MNAAIVEGVEETSDAEGAVPPTFTFGRSNPEERAWLQPLRRAAIRSLLPHDWPHGKVAGRGIVTGWDPRLEAPLYGADPDKHARYASHMLAAISAEMPWLIHLLELASAALVVGPGCCCYQLPDDPESYDIPELLHLTHFLPWVEPAERAIPH